MRCSRFTHNQDTIANEQDYVDLGLSCADICRALGRGMNGKKPNDLNQSVCDAISQLMTRVEPAVCLFRVLLLTAPPIAGLSQKCRRRSPNRANVTKSLEFFMRGMIRRRLLVGSRTSAGFCMSSTCVQCTSAWSSLISLSSDRACLEYSHHGFRRASECVEAS